MIGILVLIPTAIYMNPTMALILATLAVVYVLANVLVGRRTSTGQAAVEQFHNNVYGRVGDVLGNVTVVQSYARFASEMQAMRSIMGELLAAQYPVLTWWGLLTVLTRIAATVAVVGIYAVGAVLVGQGKISVGEILAFVGFAAVMIGKLDRCRASPSHLPVRPDLAQLLTCSTPPKACARSRMPSRSRTWPATCATRM